MKRNSLNTLSLDREDIILTEHTPFLVSEAYKAARTKLMFLTGGEQCPMIAFSSAFAGEGKTTTCINMAITFAQTGSKILVIDADMRRPQMHKYFEVDSAPGLSDRLGGFTNESCIKKTKYDNLFVIPVGMIPPNPAELLSSKEAAIFFEELKTQFDYVFIDTPPVNVVTDAAVISGILSGVVLVARQGITTTDSLKVAVNALEQLKVKILGFVLNDVTMEKNSYGYRSRYGYKYGYGYGYDYAGGYGYGNKKSSESDAGQPNS